MSTEGEKGVGSLSAFVFHADEGINDDDGKGASCRQLKEKSGKWGGAQPIKVSS